MSPLNRRQLMQALIAGGAGLTLLGRFPMQGMAALSPLLGPETRPDPSKPEGVDLLPQIDHVVVLMMENHSFDNYFGVLGRGDGHTLDGDGLPTATNLDTDGNPVRAYRAPSTAQDGVNVHQNWNASHRQYGGGTNDQFVVESGPEAMSYWTADDIPFYHGLANAFPVCDRFFCSVLGPTYPNRRFLTGATAMGVVRTDVEDIINSAVPPNGIIFERLDAYGISWANFSAGLPEVALWPSYWQAHTDMVRPIDEFYLGASAGSLPFFSLVTPPINIDEHPPQDISFGEQFAAGVVKAVLDSPAWDRTLLVYTYDEHGGFYDHVPPPPAVAPDGVGPATYDPTVPGADAYDRYGFRVPTVVVSPFARAGYVSSVVHDHTSILRLIETKWNLGALTARDANASNLLDTLDLARPAAFADPPSIAQPLLGYPQTPTAPPTTTTATAPAPVDPTGTQPVDTTAAPVDAAEALRSAGGPSTSPRFTG